MSPRRPIEAELIDSALSVPFLAGAVVGGLLVFMVFRLLGRERVVLKALTYSVSSRLIVGVEEVPDLAVNFRGAPITSMYSHEIVFRNVGTVALSNLTIQVSPPGGHMRRPKIRGPLGASIHHQPLPDGEGFLLTCDLLNRGESVIVDVGTVDPSDGTVTIIARDADLVVRSIPFAGWQDASQALDASKVLDLAAILNPQLKIPVQIAKKLFLS